jgi:heme exporter protein C
MEPAAITAALAGAAAFVASVLFLRTRNFRFDALALAVTQTGLIFLVVAVVAGVVRSYTGRGRWWTWDGGLTTALVCWMLYAAYLLLRRAVEEPTQRATFAAVFSIFAFVDVPIVAVCVGWWAARHPVASLWTEWTSTTAILAVSMTLSAAVFSQVLFRREQRRRESDARRREAHSVS